MASGTLSWRNSWGTRLQRLAICEMPLAAGGKLTEVSLLFLPAYGQMYREGHGRKRTDAIARVELMDQSGEGGYNFAVLLCINSSQIGTFSRRSTAWPATCIIKGAGRVNMAQTK